jgi:hypothetical protein
MRMLCVGGNGMRRMRVRDGGSTRTDGIGNGLTASVKRWRHSAHMMIPRGACTLVVFFW